MSCDDAILLIEDTPSLSRIYEAQLRKFGYQVDLADSAQAARAAYRKGGNRVVLLDLILPDGDGLDVLREMRAEDPDVKAIVITADGSINRAVAAMRGGAFDFLVKPFDENRLARAVEAACAALSDPGPGPATASDDQGGFQGFVGRSQQMRAVYDTIRDVGRSAATVFITGESGSGKEVCAQALHNLSSRRDRPFVPLNCGAIPRDLLESEVFGHLKGSFTGAIADKQGAAAAADGGTLFLDEICEMDIDLQTKLLRFLQTSTIQPVGAAQPRKVDVRIICATNRDPEREVVEGRFRSDLFYRLYVVPIHLPPLRERGRDVLEIAAALLNRYAQEEGKRFAAFAPDVEQAFLTYHWPGNIRELQNVLRNIVVRRDGARIELAMLPPQFRGRAAEAATPSPGGAAQSAPSLPVAAAPNMAGFVGRSLAQMERDFIEATIEACEGSIPKAARMLEVSPSTLYRKREGWQAD